MLVGPPLQLVPRRTKLEEMVQAGHSLAQVDELEPRRRFQEEFVVLVFYALGVEAPLIMRAESGSLDRKRMACIEYSVSTSSGGGKCGSGE